MTRPWRLTRRQRVEMEAALAGVRCQPGWGSGLLPALVLLVGDDWQAVWGQADPPVLRARVAIALRAALLGLAAALSNDRR
jgi:hypothetical protein